MTCARQNITAIIYDKKGRILSIGKNSYVKTHPLQAKLAAKAGDPKAVYLHAEIDAIVRCKDLQKAHTIEVLRIGKDGTLLPAKPCKICAPGIVAAGIKRVKHS